MTNLIAVMTVVCRLRFELVITLVLTSRVSYKNTSTILLANNSKELKAQKRGGETMTTEKSNKQMPHKS